MPEVIEPGGEGGSIGAATIVSQHQSMQLLGGTQLERVVEVGARSIPTGVFFQFRLGALGYTRAVGQAYADGFGLAIEAVVAEPTVAGADYVQDVSPAGHLLDQLEIFWQSLDGSSEGSIIVPLGSLDPTDAIAKVHTAMAAFA